MFVDSHIHISRRQFDGSVPCITSEKEQERIVYLTRAELIQKMKENGIGFVIEPGVELESNDRLLTFAGKFPEFIYPVVGVHPTRCFLTKWKNRSQVGKYSADERVVAIGELGLDYHYERKKQHRFIQKRWFRWQLRLADRRGLPLVLHIRKADADAVRILRRYKKKLHGGVCHCFCGGPEQARIYTEELGLCLGIGASLVSPYSAPIVEAVKETPLEYIMLETDGPFVKQPKPEDKSKKQWLKARNTGLIIPDIAAEVARIKGVDVSEVERITTENVKRVFGIN